MKKPEGKPEPTLVYWSAIKLMAKVRRFGIEKHGNSEDWRSTKPIQHFDAALRHLYAILDGEEFDAESGLPHIAHAMTGLMFELERRYGSNKQQIVRYKSLK